MSAQVIFTTTTPELEFKSIVRDAVRDALNEREEQQQKPKQQTELCSRAETAEFFGVSLPTLNDWTKRGVIKGYRIGGKVRYKRAEIENALREIGSLKYRRGA